MDPFLLSKIDFLFLFLFLLFLKLDRLLDQHITVANEYSYS